MADRLTEGPSGRLIALLRRGRRTIDELAAALGVTGNAVRAQISALERDGLVERATARAGPTKPAQTYRLSHGAELLLSRAYVPVLTQLLHVLARRMSVAEFDAVMREVGRSLTHGRPAPQGTLADRVHAGSTMLNELGGLTEVEERDGGFVIRGSGCPLAAATDHHPEACTAVQSFLSEVVGADVRKCCARNERMQCCFEVGLTAAGDHRRDPR